MLTPLITEIQRFSLQDGPGIRTTVYLKGCPLHCPWCHNPETMNAKQELYFHTDRCTGCGRCVEICPSGSLGLIQTPGKKISLTTDRRTCTSCLKCVEACPGRAHEAVGKPLDMSAVVQEALSDEIFYKHSGGGVTISGGEPLLYPEYLLELTQKLKAEGNVHIAIETSCFAKWHNIKPLLQLIDLFIVDIKSMCPVKYKNVIGGSLQMTLLNIERLIRLGKTVRIHLPIIPGFNDGPADTKAYVEYLGQFADKLSGVDVLPYHSYATGKYSQLGRENQYRGIKDLGIQQVMPLVNALRHKGLQVTVGGIVGTTSLTHAAT